MELSIIIPVYNEEERIENTLKNILIYLRNKKIDYELIVVDDGSTDDTEKKVLAFSDKCILFIKNKCNLGKGFAIKTGILLARYNLIFFCDADLATPIEELDNLLIFSNNYDVVIASRNLKDSKIIVSQPLHRQFLGKIFPLIVRFILLISIKDTQCGFKLFNANIAKKIVALQKINGFCFDAEILFICIKIGGKIKEIPVTWIDKKGSKVRPFKDAGIMFRDLLLIKYYAFLGEYKL